MKLKLFVMSMATVVLASCGGSGETKTESSENTETVQKEVVLKAAQTEFKGDLKGCFEVVDKNYKVKFGEHSFSKDIVVVELKRTSQELPYDRKDVVLFHEAEESSASVCASFGIEVLDENGDVVEKLNANEDSYYSYDDMTAVLQLLPDETATIAFHLDDLSKGATFRVLSLVQANDKRNSDLENEIDALGDMAKKAAELADDADLEKAAKDAESALEVATKSMEAAGKMMEALGGLGR